MSIGLRLVLALHLLFVVPATSSTSSSCTQAAIAGGRAIAQGVPVVQALHERAVAIRMAARASSLPSVASGLKGWHAFAVNVLQYELMV